MIYPENSANFPRIKTDSFFADYDISCSFDGIIDKTFRFLEDFQLKSPEHFARFVRQYLENADSDGGWRGEYWGKMMRGACFVYSYRKDKELYNILRDTVIDMMNTVEPCGRISAYDIDSEFRAWDMWSRKYVLLGMQYFLEITDDSALCEKIIQSMKSQVDYIISKIGPRHERKLPITAASCNWRGLNSSSVLEPVVRLYSITKEKRYLDFAEYIVNEGGTQIANIFELAYRDELLPYQYPITKAYEMISCFEGLIEYYRITGIEKYKAAAVNFANRVLQSDFTVIGCSGCTHELFDHSAVRQANTDNGFQQETCVTVTLMKFMYQLTVLTGDTKYIDAFETSLYNAYLGAVNTGKVIESVISEKYPNLIPEPLPFTSYSPLTAGSRDNIIGGFQIMSDNHYYGCCVCIGSAGIGIVPKMAVQKSRHGLAVNLFIRGTVITTLPSGRSVTLTFDTDYPVFGQVKLSVECDCEEFEILIRNPAFSKNTKLSVNGEAQSVNDGYIRLCREWQSDEINIEFDMTTRVIRPIPYGSQVLMSDVLWEHNMQIPKFDREDPAAKNHIALKRGPLVLAQDSQLGYDLHSPVSVKINEDGTVSTDFPLTDTAPYEHIIELIVPLTDGKSMTVTDYASAGKLVSKDNLLAAWILTKSASEEA